jgi:hypothetical protein
MKNRGVKISPEVSSKRRFSRVLCLSGWTPRCSLRLLCSKLSVLYCYSTPSTLLEQQEDRERHSQEKGCLRLKQEHRERHSQVKGCLLSSSLQRAIVAMSRVNLPFLAHTRTGSRASLRICIQARSCSLTSLVSAVRLRPLCVSKHATTIHKKKTRCARRIKKTDEANAHVSLSERIGSPRSPPV